MWWRECNAGWMSGPSSSLLGTLVAPAHAWCPCWGLGSQYHFGYILRGPCRECWWDADDCQSAAAWVLSAVRRGIPVRLSPPWQIVSLNNEVVYIATRGAIQDIYHWVLDHAGMSFPLILALVPVPPAAHLCCVCAWAHACCMH